MSNQTVNILRRATGKNGPYNILTFDTHERYQTQLCKTGHNFYSFRYPNCKVWDTTYAPLPPNYYVMPDNYIINGVGFDFILAQSKWGQFQAAKYIQQIFPVPIVVLEHTLPIPSWPSQQLEALRQMKGNINVYTSDYAVREWKHMGVSFVVHHSVDTEIFNPGENVRNTHGILSVVNDFANRDYCCNYEGWKRVTKDLPVRLVGNSPGISEAAPSVEALVNEYRSMDVFFNSSTISPVPTALLEAMACGCAVVSTATCMIPEIIENGVNGFTSNDEGELRGYLEKLLSNSDLRAELGHNAVKTIREKFSEERFVREWNQVFDLAYGA